MLGQMQGHWWKLDHFLARIPRFEKTRDGPTDKQTDGRTDRPKYRVAFTRLISPFAGYCWANISAEQAEGKND